MAADGNQSSQGTGMSSEERKILDLLSQERWRKARDEAKPLVKTDRGRYLPLLIKANVGLTRAMLAKGQNSEARQVIAYLKTIAPRAAWEALDAESAVASGDYAPAVSTWARLLTQADSRLSESEKRRLADQLVIAFEPVAPEATGVDGLAAELAAIRKALDHISAEQYALASESLRPLGSNSVFRHWKLYIKGLAAFYTGDNAKAARMMTELPPDSVTARAAAPYLYWLDPRGRRLQDMPEPALQILARFSGCAESAASIAKAERLWQEDKPQEMYILLRNGLEGFPSERLDWIGALSEFSLHCPSIMPRDKSGSYLSFLEKLESTTKSLRERKMLLRVLCLDFEASNPVYLQEDWEHFLQIRERLDGPNAGLSSAGYEWLGSVLLGVDTLKSFGLAPGLRAAWRPANGQAAARALEKSVQLDPANFSAHLMLVHLYDRLKRHRERNRLLDEMTGRFPEEKSVLILAGNRCIDRKAYVKGLSYLTRALEHDRLDPAIPEAIVIGRLRYALEQYRRGRTAEARITLEEAEGFAVERHDDFVRSRWCMLLRQGVLEQIYGDPALAEKLVAASRRASPSVEAFLLFGHILSRLYERARIEADPFAGEFRAGLLRHATAGRAILLVCIYEFWRSRRGAPPLDLARSLIREYLTASARGPFSRAEASDLIERIPDTSPFEAERRQFIKSVLKKDRRDPLFRLYDYRDRNWGFENTESSRHRLENIMKDAVLRKDEAAIQAIRRELQALDAALPEPFAGDQEDWEDIDFEDEEDFDAEDMLDQILSSLSPDERGACRELADMLINASDREVRKIQKMKPKGVPQVFFDLFLDAVRARRQAELQPQPSRRRNPKQGSLF
jgi:hypothetical protein